MSNRIDLFQLGDFTLASGQKSNFKIECDALSDKEIAALAAMLVMKLRPFGIVEGVPRGGLRLAAALRPYAVPGERLLVVDDVWTTGGSLKKLIGKRTGGGAVLFARGPAPYWVTPLFQM